MRYFPAECVKDEERVLLFHNEDEEALKRAVEPSDVPRVVRQRAAASVGEAAADSQS